MPEVLWTDEACSHLDDILAYIEQHNPTAAIDLVETIVASGNALRSFPARNPVRHEGGLPRHQIVDRGKAKRHFAASDVPMVAFAALVVVAQHDAVS